MVQVVYCFIVMKAHVNNSYIRKIHNNTTLIVRNVFVFYLKNNYCFFGKKNPQGRSVESKQKKEPRQKFSGTAERALGMLLLTKQFKDLFECN